MHTLAAAAPPDPVDTASQLVSNVGDQVVDAALGIAPIAVPFLLSLLVLRMVMSKFMLAAAKGGGGGGYAGGGWDDSVSGYRCHGYGCKALVDPGEGRYCYRCEEDMRNADEWY